MEGDPDRYRFGPLERRGLVAGWRAGQIGSVAAGLIVAVVILRSRSDPLAVVVAVVAVAGGVALGCWPVAGQAGDQWLPTVVRWGAQSTSGRHRWRSPLPSVGRLLGGGLPGDRLPGGRLAGDRLPGSAVAKGSPFDGLDILEVRTATAGGRCGVVHDARSGTYTAVLEVRGHTFALLGTDEKARRVAGWSTVLSSLARERPVVHRLQWLATTLPDDGRAVDAFLGERATLGPEQAARRSYAALLTDVGASTCRHEVHLAVQVRGRSVGRQHRMADGAAGGTAGAMAGGRAGGRADPFAGGRRGVGRGPGRHVGPCLVLEREVAAIRRALGDADVAVEAVLDPTALVTLFRRSGQPGPVGVATNEAPGNETATAVWPWPMALQTEWRRLRTDGTWQATYWIAEWPRVDVGPDFLGPLLLGSVRRTVSVVMEPLSPSRAIRQAEQARTADVADAELRRRGGFLATARRSREAELATRREAELAEGYAAVRFSGYVTVTASTADQLENACDATEQAAGQCRLELRRLYGEQDRAFTFTLPLGRGLR